MVAPWHLHRADQNAKGAVALCCPGGSSMVSLQFQPASPPFGVLRRSTGGWLAARASRLAVLALAMASLTGCPVVPDPQQSDATAPIELSGAILLRNPAAKRIDVLKQSGNGLAVTQLTYDGKPTVTQVTADGSKALWLDPAKRNLASCDGKAAVVYALPSEFAAVRAGDDSASAVLFHPSGGTSATSIVNSDEVALVDLTAAPTKSNPRVATVSGLTRAPVTARVAPPITAGDGKHHLVWMEAQGRIGIADFGPTKVRTAVVPLAADLQALMLPIRTVVRVSPGAADLYLLVDALNDVVHVRIDLAGAELAISLDQIAAGADPADLHLYDAKEGLRVLVANLQAKSLSVLDPATGSGQEIPIGGPVSRFVPVTAADGKARVLAWWHSGGQNRLWIVELDDLAKKKGKAIRPIQLDLAVMGIQPVGGQVVLEHQSSLYGASLLDVVTGKITQFSGAGKVKQVRTLGAVGSASVWIVGTSGNDTRVSRIALSDQHGASLNIAVNGDKLLPIGDGVALLGQGLAGWWVAFFPKGELDKSKASWLEGFGLTNWTGR